MLANVLPNGWGICFGQKIVIRPVEWRLHMDFILSTWAMTLAINYRRQRVIPRFDSYSIGPRDKIATVVEAG